MTTLQVALAYPCHTVASYPLGECNGHPPRFTDRADGLARHLFPRSGRTCLARPITDPLFYRLFATSPETFFLLLGMPPEAARAMAARYEYQAIEFKETSHRTDGVFLPKEPGLPIYFLEVQFYALPSVFADLLAKAYTYLKQHDPAQSFRGIVLFASRALEPLGMAPYQPLLDAGLVQCFYLDELPELPNAPLGLSYPATDWASGK